MIYTVVIKASSRVAGTTTTNPSFNVNWGALLPDNQAFKLTFGFISDTVNITSFTSPCQLLISLGQSNSWRNSTTSSSPPPTNLLGYLIPTQLGTTTFLFAGNGLNQPIYLKSRPYGNNFFAQITSTIVPAGPWLDNVGATIANYDLILYFEPVPTSPVL